MQGLRCRAAVATVLVVCALGAPTSASAQADAVAQARALAATGRQSEALAVLDARLTDVPDDGDARLLRGLVLSWQSRYAPARIEIERVLSRDPTRADAIAALARIELWDRRPLDSEQLAAEGLELHPEDLDLMEIRALALESLGRMRDAMTQVTRVLERDPRRDAARRLRRRLLDRQPAWLARMSWRQDRFDDGRTAWNEAQLSFGRQTPAGTIGANVYTARRAGAADRQVELEAYPKFGRSAYAYVAAALSARGGFYPTRRIAADFYQSLGRGWEVGAGARDLEFSSSVYVYNASVSKAAGSWLLGGRTWVRPVGDRRDVTVETQLRRYAPDGESYWGVRYSRGGYRDDLRLVPAQLHSDLAGAEASRRVGRLAATVLGIARREERRPSEFLWHWTITLTTQVKF